eukprot:8065811-Alexandrium_andersonii.AAC.1
MGASAPSRTPVLTRSIRECLHPLSRARRPPCDLATRPRHWRRDGAPLSVDPRTAPQRTAPTADSPPRPSRK